MQYLKHLAYSRHWVPQFSSLFGYVPSALPRSLHTSTCQGRGLPARYFNRILTSVVTFEELCAMIYHIWGDICNFKNSYYLESTSNKGRPWYSGNCFPHTCWGRPCSIYLILTTTSLYMGGNWGRKVQWFAEVTTLEDRETYSRIPMKLLQAKEPMYSDTLLGKVKVCKMWITKDACFTTNTKMYTPLP
jgi:hypothetical protein